MNMSYCRFYNTVIDLDDCINALENKDFDNISDDEKRSIVKLLTYQLNSLNSIKENIECCYDEDINADIINKWVEEEE